MVSPGKLPSLEKTGSKHVDHQSNDVQRSDMATRVYIVTHRKHVKDVKTAAESLCVFDKSLKIRELSQDDLLEGGCNIRHPTLSLGEVDSILPWEGYLYTIPTNLVSYDTGEEEENVQCLDEKLKGLGADWYRDVTYCLEPEWPPSHRGHLPRHYLHRAIMDWLEVIDCDNSIRRRMDLFLLDSYTRIHDRTPHVIYGPMLLYTSEPFKNWRMLFDHLKPDEMEALYASIASQKRVTHIAVNAPIPLRENPDGNEGNQESFENIMRKPINFRPLFGDFGGLCESDDPTQQCFDSAFWVHTVQTGITQFWAPRYTMFSRGNIKEKARLLTLDTVVKAVQDGEDHDTGCSAVDLYAGIGYFAFSYARAGVDKVLCWELNPWSVEGMVRGAGENGWDILAYTWPPANQNRYMDFRAGQVDIIAGDADIVVFQETNAHAPRRLHQLRQHVPPIRHVNCGLLPSSRESWPTAVGALDPALGGWVHVHENIAELEVADKSWKILDEFKQLLQSFEHVGEGWEAELLHVEKIKTFAPGVAHYVLDIAILPGGH